MSLGLPETLSTTGHSRMKQRTRALNAFSLRLILILATLTCVCAALIGGFAPTDSTHSVRARAQITAAGNAWRASLPIDPERATQAYLVRIPAIARERSDAYFEGGYWLSLWNQIAFVSANVLLLLTGFARQLRDALIRVTHRPWLQSLLFALIYFTMLAALLSPLSVYQGFFREHQYGLSNQNFLAWLTEASLASAISVSVASAFACTLLLIARYSPERWWLWGAALGMALLAFQMLIQPAYIDPLFNTYRPLEDGPIKAAVVSLARANGVPTTQVLQFDESRQSDRISANVSGLLGTAAIRLNDNLLRRTSLPEIKAVTAHEVGHYVLHHVYQSLLVSCIFLMLAFVTLRTALRWALHRWSAALKVRGVADPSSLPLAIIVLSVYLFLIDPILTLQTRVNEAEADSFGLNAAAEPDGFAEVMLKLTEYRKADPGPVEEALFFDHPSAANRIRAAMRWKAEHIATNVSHDVTR